MADHSIVKERLAGCEAMPQICPELYVQRWSSDLSSTSAGQSNVAATLEQSKLMSYHDQDTDHNIVKHAAFMLLIYTFACMPVIMAHMLCSATQLLWHHSAHCLRCVIGTSDNAALGNPSFANILCSVVSMCLSW